MPFPAEKRTEAKMEEYIKEINDEKFKIEPQNFLISGII
jgi:hypothetical protein